MTGKENFRINGEPSGFTFADFWRFQYSNIYSLHGEIAEFLVARALGIQEAQNSEYWTLWDITYQGVKIEVKATAYYHLWNTKDTISRQRTFSIAKANGAYDFEKSGNAELRRQNDIYVFCLNTGESKEEADPLNLDNWEFFVVPTLFLDEHCANQKTISLGRICSLGFPSLSFLGVKTEIDRVIKEYDLLKTIGEKQPYNNENG